MRYAVVTGWRNFEQPSFRDDGPVVAALKAAAPAVVIHGGAQGVDAEAGKWARNNATEMTVPANWARDGKKAGPLRNAAMMRIGADLQALGHHVVVLAFPKPGVSRGTYNAIRLAREAGLSVEVHEL